MSVMTAQKPLLLKDFLELDSESCGGGFGCAPWRTADAGATVRYLLRTELLAGEGRSLCRSRSMSALTRISAVIKLLPFYSSSNERSSFLPRSFSKKLKASFWKKRGTGEENEDRVRVKDIMRLRSFEEEMDGSRSFDFGSPVLSSCSSCADDSSDFVPSSADSSECLGEYITAEEGKKDLSPSPRRSPRRSPDGRKAVAVYTVTATGHLEPTAVACECRSEGEKEQLSPVSVMDFPYEEEEENEDDDATSRSFHRSLANIERTKHELLQKIRRFENLAELGPVELEGRFASLEKEEASHMSESSDHAASDVGDEEHATEEWKAWALFSQLKAASVLEPSCENLLLDFFIERLSSGGVNHSIPSMWRTYTEPSSGAREAEVLQAARDWVTGRGPREEQAHRGEATLGEIERNGRWRFFKVEEEELGVDLEGFVLGSLMQELVLDLLPCCGVNQSYLW